ncbi:MAG: hypothetical protein WCH75_23845 [Candidatus Binatia bacterium]
MQLKLKIEETVPSAVRSALARYKILVFCNKCAGLHETGISVTLGDGPSAKRSLGEFYGEKGLPKSLAHVMNNSVTCPRTGKQSTQKDSHQIFLVPSSS